jgi:hypothetical protein
MKEESRDPGAVRYFYNREERMAALPDHVQRPSRKGVFKGNRSLLITLIDVAFLILLVAAFSVFSLMTGNARVIPGYSATAKASQFDDRVLVSIRVVAREDHDEAQTVRIRLSYPEGSERVEVSGYLPTEKGSEVVFRGALPYDADQSRLIIDLFANGSQGSLKERIRRE